MRFYLAFGSNLGDRLAHLRYARSEVMRLTTSGSLEAAGLYQSDPVDCPPGSAPFLNTVVGGTTTLSAERILISTQAIEAAAGRPKTVIRNAPRCLDIDLLLLDDLMMDTNTLTIPHPRLHLRRFVLEPLAELAPDLVIPGIGISVSKLCASLDNEESPPVRLTSCW
jgi:2-amino-4-hydroxy-6-hydroxymethyldihydropteridine diphosphokinase